MDVDILFTENATIGEKVQLSEKIIAVMRAMNCPHPLQANQVQGSDWANVLPVMSWLITKTVENRERTALQLKRVVQMQFGKHLAPLPHEDRNPKVDSGLPDVMARYTAKRRCRLLVPQADQGSEASRVHSVLLEYGETLKSRYGLAGGGGSDGGAATEATAGAGGAGGNVNANALTFAGVSGSGGDDKQLSAFERKLVAAAKKAALAEAELATATSLEEDALLQSMQTLEGATGNASSKRVGSIVGLGTHQIAAAAARYQESVEEARRKVRCLYGLVLVMHAHANVHALRHVCSRACVFVPATSADVSHVICQFLDNFLTSDFSSCSYGNPINCIPCDHTPLPNVYLGGRARGRWSVRWSGSVPPAESRIGETRAGAAASGRSVGCVQAQRRSQSAGQNRGLGGSCCR